MQGAHGVLLTNYIHNIGVYGNTNELGQMARGEIMHLQWTREQHETVVIQRCVIYRCKCPGDQCSQRALLPVDPCRESDKGT